MSTDTGPAYKLKNSTDLISLSSLLGDIRDNQIHFIRQEVLHDIVYRFDNDVSNTLSFKDFFGKWFESFQSDRRHEPGYVAPIPINIFCLPQLVFHKNEVRGETYVRLLGFSKNNIELFSQLSCVEKEITYYNGSDSQLNHMSEKEWYDLGAAWSETDTLLPNLTLRLWDDYMVPTIISGKHIRENISSYSRSDYDERCRTRFNVLYANVVMADENQKIDSSYDFSKLFDIQRSVREYDFWKNNWEVLAFSEGRKEIIEKLKIETELFVENNPIVCD